ncbi:MAG TPA: hypothetical protein VKR58_02810 [Aquella sp.]|nr:hypothetical protein [Aquella sp.]
MSFPGQKYVASEEEINKAINLFINCCIFFIISLITALILTLYFKSPMYILGSIITICSAVYNLYANIEKITLKILWSLSFLVTFWLKLKSDWGVLPHSTLIK